MSTEETHQPETQPSGELVPPKRRPPTAVGARTPEPPIHVPRRHTRPWRRRGLLRFITDAASDYVELLGAAAGRLVRAASQAGKGRHT